MKRMRIEALIASPPTLKCEKILALLDEISTQFADRVQIDIYLAGEQPGTDPTKGYKDKGKFKRVPAVFVNGTMLIQAEVPERAELDALVVRELAKGEDGWQD